MNAYDYDETDVQLGYCPVELGPREPAEPIGRAELDVAHTLGPVNR